MISRLFAPQLPVPGRALALVTTYTPEVIRHFCTQAFQKYLRRERQAIGKLEAAVHRAAITRLRLVFPLAYPEAWLNREGDDE